MLSVIFCCALIIANVLAVKTLDFGLLALPASILVFPITYIVNDILSDIFGFKRTRKVILMGFGAITAAALLYHLSIALPGLDPTMNAAYEQTLSSSWRILLESFAAYLFGSLLNSLVMTRLKRRFDNQLFFRCVTSTALGEAVDSICFITIAFAGTYSIGIIITMIVSQVLLKTLYEIILYPATKIVIKKIRAQITP